MCIRDSTNTNLTICIPATTFPATLNAFYNVGFEDVILCDIGDNLCIDIDTLSEKQKKRIDIIIPVSLMGFPPNMDKIMDASEKYGWVVVEDFAEAFGTEYNGKKIGSIGHFGTSSFYISHAIQGGELGIVTSNSESVTKVLRSMKNHGRTGSNFEFNHSYIGSNYKTTEFCAGLAYPQILDAENTVRKRWNNANMISSGIKNKKLIPVQIQNNVSFLGLPIIAETESYRDHICRKLNTVGVETRDMFPCLKNQECYAALLRAVSYTHLTLPTN